MPAEKLTKQEIFRHLRPDQLDRLSSSARVLKLPAGRMIYSQGSKADNFHIVLKGQVALRIPGQHDLNLIIDELFEGDLFGGCISTALDTYSLDAQCVDDSEILVLESAALKRLMDEDPRTGYVIQSRISEIYFKRYIATMEKLQAIVMGVPAGTV